MIVTCPACASQFRLPDGALGAGGRKLRCSACRHVWFALPPEAPSPEPAPEPEPPSPAAPEPETPQGETPQAATPEAPDAVHPQPEGRDTSVEDAAVAPSSGSPQDDADAPSVATAEVSDSEAEPADMHEEQEPSTVAPQAPDDAAPRPGSVPNYGWEPGAVMPRGGVRQPATEMPRGGVRQPATETPRSGLRLVEPPAAVEDAGAAHGDTADAGPPASPSYDVTRVVAPDSAPEEVERPRRRRRGGGAFLVLLLLIGIGAAAYFERNQVMRYLPWTAQFYAMAGLVGAPSSQDLQLQDASFRVDLSGEFSSLVISGSVVNVGPDYRLLPELSAELVTADARTTQRWTFEALADGLAPGDTTLFREVIADPPRTGEDKFILITFADR